MPAIAPDKSAHYRRRQYLIDKNFQFRFIWRFIMIVIGSIVFSHLLTWGYLKFKEVTDASSQNVIYLASTFRETLQYSQILDRILPPLLATMLLGIVLVFILGLFYSHRIAGPLFNLKRTMRQLGEGDLNATLRIRKSDELHDVEETFNQMTEGLRQQKKNRRPFPGL